MNAIFKLLFVFLAVFAVGSAWAALGTIEEEPKAVEVVSAPAVAALKATEAHLPAAEAAKLGEQSRPKRSCKKIGFKSKSGRTVEGSHGC